jgi:hypothetical protein
MANDGKNRASRAKRDSERPLSSQTTTTPLHRNLLAECRCPCSPRIVFGSSSSMTSRLPKVG